MDLLVEVKYLRRLKHDVFDFTDQSVGMLGVDRKPDTPCKQQQLNAAATATPSSKILDMVHSLAATPSTIVDVVCSQSRGSKYVDPPRKCLKLILETHS